MGDETPDRQIHAGDPAAPRQGYPVAAAMRPQRLSAYQRRLLDTLRLQKSRIRYGFFRREAAPELFDLGLAAAAARGRTVRFGGVRFELRFGWWKYVIDPETGETLTGADSGFFS